MEIKSNETVILINCASLFIFTKIFQRNYTLKKSLYSIIYFYLNLFLFSFSTNHSESPAKPYFQPTRISRCLSKTYKARQSSPKEDREMKRNFEIEFTPQIFSANEMKLC